MILLKIILLLILVLTLLILFAPFKYSALVFIKENFNISLYIDWVILKIEFLLKEGKPFIKIYIFRKMIKSFYPKFKKAKVKYKIKKEKFHIPSKDFFVEMFSLFKEIFNIIKPKNFIANGTYGFEDPSLTGILNLVVIFIKGVIPSAIINLNPTYEENVIDIEISTYGSVSLISLIFTTLKYVLKKEVRKVLFHKSKKTETLKEY